MTITADETDELEEPPPITSRTVAGKPAPPVLSVTGGGRRRNSSRRRKSNPVAVPRLTLSDRPLHRSQVEIDRDGGIILVSLKIGDQLPDEVDFVYFDENDDVSHLEVVLKLLMPTAGGTGNAAVLSTRDWRARDFEAFEKMLDSLPA